MRVSVGSKGKYEPFNGQGGRGRVASDGQMSVIRT